MKIKRYKKAEKFMTLYKNNYGFREPYQILLDGTFCQVALTHKVNIQDQLPRYLSGQCKFLTTACVVEETKKLGKPLHGAYLVVSQYPVHDCGHSEPVSANKCLSSFVIETKNKDHYLVATQDHKLRMKISKEAVCPLIKLANNALVIEKPPPQVLKKISRTHHYLANKLKDDEKINLQKSLEEENMLQTTVVENIVKKKRKGPKRPNPLSCKKKKTSSTNKSNKKASEGVSEDDAINDKKRRRKKLHIASHVKKFLKGIGPEK